MASSPEASTPPVHPVLPPPVRPVLPPGSTTPASAAAHAVPDRCPGALRPFAATDGLIARVRLAGAPLTTAQARGIGALATSLGDGGIHFTTRANVQVRGLDEDGARVFAQSLAELGLLPSPTHERARNIVVAPFAGPAILDLARALDAEMCSRPALAALSGRFLVGLDDGDGALLALPLDIAVQLHQGRARTALGSDPRGYDAGPVTDPAQVATALADIAEDLVALAAEEEVWNVDDLSQDGTDELHARVEGRLPAAPSLRVRRVEPVLAGTVDAAPASPGTVWVAATAPLAEISAAGWQAACDAADDALGQIRVTPWHAVVIEGVAADDVDAVLARLAAGGWVVSPDSAWLRLHGCTGEPRCARALSDVQSQTRALVAAAQAAAQDTDAVITPADRPVMVAGCPRRCGHPPVPHLSVVATDRDRFTLTEADGTHGPQPQPFATATSADLADVIADVLARPTA